jgi:hypothetical protein
MLKALERPAANEEEDLNYCMEKRVDPESEVIGVVPGSNRIKPKNQERC